MALLVGSQKCLKFGFAGEDLAGDSSGCLCPRGLLGYLKFVSLKPDPAYEKIQVKSTSGMHQLGQQINRSALHDALGKHKPYRKI